MKIKRREFIKKSAIGAGVILVGAQLHATENIFGQNPQGTFPRYRLSGEVRGQEQ